MGVSALTVEQADRAAGRARTHLVRVLAGACPPHSLDYENPHAEEVVGILGELCGSRDAFERHAAEVAKALERALPAVRGEDVSFNGVGVLQMSGVAIDQLAMLFVKQRLYAYAALTRYHRHEVAAEAAGDVEAAT